METTSFKIKKKDIPTKFGLLREEYEAEGWTTLFQNEKKLVLIDPEKNLVSFASAWEIFYYKIYQERMESDQIEQVDINITPTELVSGKNGIGSYAAGGALEGGIAGMLVGSALDALVGPKIKKVTVLYSIGEKSFFGKHLSYWSIDGELTRLTEDNIKEIFQRVEMEIETLIKIFGKKVKINCEDT